MAFVASRSSSWRGCWNNLHIVMRSQVLKMTWAKPSSPLSSGENEESYREHSNHRPEHVPRQSSAVCLSSWTLSSPPSSLLWGCTCLLCFVLIYSVLVMPIPWAIRLNIICLSLFHFLDGNWRVWMMWKDVIFILSWKLFRILKAFFLFFLETRILLIPEYLCVWPILSESL